MSKHSFKHHIICVILVSLICSSIPILGSSISSVNDTLDNSYTSLSNIQKQLRAIIKNSYINQVANASNTSNTKQLDIYSSQLTKIKSDLYSASILNNPETNKAKLQGLLTVSSYLSYIVEKAYEYLSTTDSSNQYEILDSISISNSLVRQIFSYIAPQ